MVDWSQLPYDLIILIANQLHAVEDFLSFSAVCCSWRLVYLKKNWNPSRRLPWLMLNENHNCEVPTRRFFSIYMNKVYKLPLPEAYGRRFWGSSHGWLVTIGHDLEIRLLNPVTQVCINLPPHSTFENQVRAGLDWFNFIHKATVFKIRGEFVTMVIYGQEYSLALARPGDSAWTTVQIPVPFLFINVVCIKDQIFALSMAGTLVRVEIDGPDPPRAVHIASPPQCEKGREQMCLVESSGDLLMIYRYENLNWLKVVHCEVYKFDFRARKWTILEDLGDCVIFVDDSYCTSVSACDEFKCNSIYFAKDNLDFWLTCEQKCEGYYMDVYHMKDETTETFCLGDDSPSCYTCPVWVLPTL